MDEEKDSKISGHSTKNRFLKRALSIILTALFCFAFFLVLMTLPGCFGGPGGSVKRPVAVPDGAGGAFVIYQVYEDKDRTTYLQRLDAQGKALWSQKGIIIGSEKGGLEGTQDAAIAVSDGANGVIVVWGQAGMLKGRQSSPIYYQRFQRPYFIYPPNTSGDKFRGIVTCTIKIIHCSYFVNKT